MKTLYSITVGVFLLTIELFVQPLFNQLKPSYASLD